MSHPYDVVTKREVHRILAGTGARVVFGSLYFSIESDGLYSRVALDPTVPTKDLELIGCAKQHRELLEKRVA